MCVTAEVCGCVLEGIRRTVTLALWPFVTCHSVSGHTWKKHAHIHWFWDVLFWNSVLLTFTSVFLLMLLVAQPFTTHNDTGFLTWGSRSRIPMRACARMFLHDRHCSMLSITPSDQLLCARIPDQQHHFWVQGSLFSHSLKWLCNSVTNSLMATQLNVSHLQLFRLFVWWLVWRPCSVFLCGCYFFLP